MALLELLARKGATEVLRELERGPKRFSEVVSILGTIVVRRTIARRLKELEKAGLIERQITEERPPHSIYMLTKKGKETTKLLTELER